MNLTNLARLTKRQLEVLELCCAQGMTSPQAGDALGISDQTVKNHRTAINRTLDSRSTQFACYLYGMAIERQDNRSKWDKYVNDL